MIITALPYYVYITLLSEHVGARATYAPEVEAGSVSCRPRWERNPVVATPDPPRCGVGPDAPPADRESVPGGTSPVSTWVREKKAPGTRKCRYSFFKYTKRENTCRHDVNLGFEQDHGRTSIAFPRFLASSLAFSTNNIGCDGERSRPSDLIQWVWFWRRERGATTRSQGNAIEILPIITACCHLLQGKLKHYAVKSRFLYIACGHFIMYLTQENE